MIIPNNKKIKLLFINVLFTVVVEGWSLKPPDTLLFLQALDNKTENCEICMNSIFFYEVNSLTLKTSPKHKIKSTILVKFNQIIEQLIPDGIKENYKLTLFTKITCTVTK